MLGEIICAIFAFNVIFEAYERVEMLRLRHAHIHILIVRSILTGLIVSVILLKESQWIGMTFSLFTLLAFVMYKDDYL